MKWTEMDDKERVRPIVQRVMGCFILEATAKGYDTPDFPRGVGALPDFHWPIAYWNTDGECWMIKDIASDPKVFDPLHDMNAAWQVYQHMAAPYNPKSRYDYEPFLRFSDDLLGIKGEIGYDELLYPSYNYTALIAKWTPERICRAALKACGVEIE